MKRIDKLVPEFVDSFPDEIKSGVLYVSIEFASVAHSCCCGCGREVVTPLSPTDWKLIFDGDTVSLDPSVGNWSFPCRSHYVISRNRVRWAGDFSPEAVAMVRRKDRVSKAAYYHEAPEVKGLPVPPPARAPAPVAKKRSKSWLSSLFGKRS